jgi:hypothetical protein
MPGLAVGMLAVLKHRAFDARAFVMEVRWILETCMLPEVQRCSAHGCLRVHCMSDSLVVVNGTDGVPTYRKVDG